MSKESSKESGTLFTSYKEYKAYVKKHGWKSANDELVRMIKEKYGENTTFNCEHCAFSALGESGYISDTELSAVHDNYMNKKKNKMYKKMGF